MTGLLALIFMLSVGCIIFGYMANALWPYLLGCAVFLMYFFSYYMHALKIVGGITYFFTGVAAVALIGLWFKRSK